MLYFWHYQKVVFTIPSDELEESIEFRLIPTITYKGLTRTIDQIYLNVEEGKDAFDYTYCKEYYDGYKTKIGIEDLNLTESPETKEVVLKAKDFSNTEEIDVEKPKYNELICAPTPYTATAAVPEILPKR